MKKIRIPKGKYCNNCIFVMWGEDICKLFHNDLTWGVLKESFIKDSACLKSFPNGAEFMLRENNDTK